MSVLVTSISNDVALINCSSGALEVRMAQRQRSLNDLFD